MASGVGDRAGPRRRPAHSRPQPRSGRPSLRGPTLLQHVRVHSHLRAPTAAPGHGGAPATGVGGDPTVVVTSSDFLFTKASPVPIEPPPIPSPTRTCRSRWLPSGAPQAYDNPYTQARAVVVAWRPGQHTARTAAALLVQGTQREARRRWLERETRAAGQRLEDARGTAHAAYMSETAQTAHASELTCHAVSAVRRAAQAVVAAAADAGVAGRPDCQRALAHTNALVGGAQERCLEAANARQAANQAFDEARQGLPPGPPCPPVTPADLQALERVHELHRLRPPPTAAPVPLAARARGQAQARARAQAQARQQAGPPEAEGPPPPGASPGPPAPPGRRDGDPTRRWETPARELLEANAAMAGYRPGPGAYMRPLARQGDVPRPARVSAAVHAARLAGTAAASDAGSSNGGGGGAAGGERGGEPPAGFATFWEFQVAWREETQNDACLVRATAEARSAWLLRHEALARRLAASDASSFPEAARPALQPLLVAAKALHPEVGVANAPGGGRAGSSIGGGGGAAGGEL